MSNVKRLIVDKLSAAPQVQLGSFSKKEAANWIQNGCRHVHSSPLGKRDAGYKTTIQSLKFDLPKGFDWEVMPPAVEVYLDSSAERQRIIQTLGETLLGDGRKSLRQRAEGVLEELISNAIYHAYRDANGKDKYNRREVVKLSTAESVQLRCRADDHGLFIGVRDNGGRLLFDDVMDAFRRCYGGEAEIQAKAGGAGLGMYMVFESVTHLKIVTSLGKWTEVTCWIADHKTHDPAVFSFNFFEEKKP